MEPVEYTVETRVIGGVPVEVRVYPSGVRGVRELTADELYWGRVRIRREQWRAAHAEAARRMADIVVYGVDSPAAGGTDAGGHK